MSVRTTYELVGGIIELATELVFDDASLLPFALVANELVTECCVTNGPATAYTDERLELIERWLTAHLYTNRDPRAASEGVGPISVSYQSSIGLGFDTSHYGQTAMRLDTNGGLAKLNDDAKKGRPRIGGVWLGTAYEDIPTN